MSETPKDKLIKGLAAFITANIIECTPKKAMDIAGWAVQRYQEQTGIEINLNNLVDVMARIIELDFTCLQISDADQEVLMRKFTTSGYSMDSELIQSCNPILIWFIRSKTGMNGGLSANLVEVLWDRLIKSFKSSNSHPELGSQRLYKILIKNFLNYITAQTELGPRQRIGVAENLAMNRIFTKAFQGDQESLTLLKDYLSEKLPPIFLKEYQGPRSEILEFVKTVIQKAADEIACRKCNYDPETQKSFLGFVLKNYLEITPEQRKYIANIENLCAGKEDPEIDEVIVKEDLRTQRSVKINTLTEIFRLVLRCGGFPHEQLSYIFVDFLAVKPDKMVERGLHEAFLQELRESFWHQIKARLFQYQFNSQKFIIYLEPLDQRLQLKVSALTSLVNHNDGKIASPVIRMEIAQTRLADYHTYSNRDINQAVSFWKDNVRQAIARVLDVQSLDLGKMVYTPDLDPTLNLPRKISRNQCKLRDIIPCGGPTGTGCFVFEIEKKR
jgi:hypothetical protein